MRLPFVCATLLYAIFGGASSARADRAEILTVRSAQAELRGRPTLDSTVMGLVRRGEEVELVRSSADRRWLQIDIGGGELAWIEARALKPGAAQPEPERHDTLRMNRSDDDAWQPERRRDEEPRRVVHEEPRELRNDPPPPPKREVREARNDPPPPQSKREAREARHEAPVPPPRQEAREVRNDPPPAPPKPKPVAPPPEEPRLAGGPMRDIPAAKPGELFDAALDDERPPSGPDAPAKHGKK